MNMINLSTSLKRLLFLGLLFPLVVLNCWVFLLVLQYFQPFVTIFVLAILLAFILNYPVQLIQRFGVKRNYAVILISVLALLILLAIGITVLPFILEEFSEMAKLLPHWIDSGRIQLQALHDRFLIQKLPINLSRLATQLTDRLPSELQLLSEQILKLALDTIDSISDVVVTLVLTFYLLLDGGRLWQGIFQRLPASFGSQVQQSLQQNFQNYFIGQVALASLVGSSMTIAFVALKVPFGLLFGLGVGIMSLIPFGDVLALSLVCLLVASHDLWLGIRLVVVVFLIDQVIDQVIAPRLLGGFTGLSPVLILVSLLVGAKVAGLLGLLIAIPLASFIKSVVDGLPAAQGDSSTSILKLAAKREQPLSSQD